MTKYEIVNRNLDLHAEWMKYVFENPEVLDKIPKGAIVVLLPEDDKRLYDENYKLIEENHKNGVPVFAVTLKSPKPQITGFEIVAV